MLTTLPRPPVRDTIEERMRKFDEWVKVFGYRPPTKDDLVPGAELLMVDVECYMERHNQGMGIDVVCNTKIKLDDEPIAPSNADASKEVVFYHCAMPPWDGQCFVPLADFCASGHLKGLYANDWRYLVKV